MEFKGFWEAWSISRGSGNFTKNVIDSSLTLGKKGSKPTCTKSRSFGFLPERENLEQIDKL